MQVQSAPCDHCQTCSRREDWDFLKGFFEREKIHLDEMSVQKSQHEGEVVKLQLQVDALQLQHTSAKAYLDDTQTRLEDLMGDYLDLQAAHASAVDQSTQRQERLEQLESCYEAQCEVVTAQAGEIKQKEKDLDAARLSVERLEGLLNSRASGEVVPLSIAAASSDAQVFTHHHPRQVAGAGVCDRKYNKRPCSPPMHEYQRLATEQDTFSVPATVVRRQGLFSTLEMSYISLNISDEDSDDEVESASDFEMVE